ncbi:MAG: CU044_2847 family protein [Ferrimicrobium acidiphilum]|jgi:hypothetical protein|nr:CU044_2847 family protein [Ferrimicrobium acidiphilum]
MSQGVVNFELAKGLRDPFAAPDGFAATFEDASIPDTSSQLTTDKVTAEAPVAGKLSEKLEPVIAAAEEVASEVHKIFSTGNISITFGISISEGLDLVIARGQGNASLSVTVSLPPKQGEQGVQDGPQH